ncbi:MAG: alanine racemase [Puniceicoccales bacterium]|nr:alanine racemase [Puniceicoccales bacterium]
MSNPALRAWVEIDLMALERNLRKIKNALPAGVRYMSVVKADAYGHDAPQVVRRLRQCGVDCFCVANVREGADVRMVCGPGVDMLVLGAVLPDEVSELAANGLTAALSAPEEMEVLASAGAGRHGAPLPVHVKVDTGMGRLGVWHEDAPEFIRAVAANPRLELRGVFTHFSCADDAREDARAFTEEQRRRFVRVVESVPAAARAKPDFLVHADNSAGLETFTGSAEKLGKFNAVRVGLLQYGVPPRKNSLLADLKPEPVLSFHSRIGLVKRLPAGTPISYNRTHVLKRDSQIAIVTAGYGDGVPIPASDRASVLIGGRRCPILGRVTMDQTVVDVSDLPVPPRAGDLVTLLGKQNGDTIPVEEFCHWADTIPWDVFCSITKRVTRVLRGERC